MTVRSLLLSLLVALAPLAALGEDAPSQKTTPQAKETVAVQPAPALPPGTYQGPEGQKIEVKEALTLGGKASDLAAKGLIIVNGRPADGSYVGPGGARFVVEEGIVVVDTRPAPSGRVSEKGIIIENAPAPSR
jgi:hypothetical protein